VWNYKLAGVTVTDYRGHRLACMKNVAAYVLLLLAHDRFNQARADKYYRKPHM